MEFLRILLMIGHIVGVAVGAGGATMSDVLFITSLRDNRIDHSELRLLKMASQIVTIGMVLLAITGAGFLLTGSPPSPRFWAKMTIVSIASINGFIMHRKLFPIFETCAKEGIAVGSADFVKHAPLMIVAGPVSAISWYAAIVLGIWRTAPFTYLQFMTIYGLLITATIAISTVAVQVMLQRPEMVSRYLGVAGEHGVEETVRVELVNSAEGVPVYEQ
ncbi:MAG: hypothetical protein ACPG8W_13630 [Candidatus Promineifilaceae bacterium]